jgi:hypothetical protein
MVRTGRAYSLGNLSTDRKRRAAYHRQFALPEYARDARNCRAARGALRAHPGHEFWADDVSLLDAQRVDASPILATNQVTDTYLLALAYRGTLATFDRRLVVDAVPDGARHLELIT